MFDSNGFSENATRLLERLGAERGYNSKANFDQWFGSQDFTTVIKEQLPDCSPALLAAAEAAARKLCWRGWSARDPEIVYDAVQRRLDLKELIESNRQLIAESKVLMDNNKHLRTVLAEQGRKSAALHATICTMAF